MSLTHESFPNKSAPAKYNGVGDTVVITGSISVSSKNLTISGATLDNKWVGKLVFVLGAGVPTFGVDPYGTGNLLTYVESINSSSVAVLHDAAYATVSSAVTYIGSGGHAAAISALVKEVSDAGGGKVEVNTGGIFFLEPYDTTHIQYQNDLGSYAKTGIVLKSNIHFECSPGTLFLMPQGGIVGGSNGAGWGNWPAAIAAFNQHNIKLTGVSVTGGLTANSIETTAFGIYINGCHDVKLRDCEVKYSNGDGVRIDQWYDESSPNIMGPPSYNIEIINCYVHHCIGQALEFNRSNKVLVDGCHLSDNLNFVSTSVAELIIVHGPCDTVRIVNCFSERWGTCTSLDGAVSGLKLSGNIFRDGVLVWADATTLSDITITDNNNILTANGTDERSRNITLRGVVGVVKIHDNILSTSYSQGIQVSSGNIAADYLISQNSTNKTIVASLGVDATKTVIVYNHCVSVDAQTSNPVLAGNG